MDYGATVDKYMGDGIMIFFGDPDTLGENTDALQCLKMALAMREKMLDLADEWRENGIENPMKLRMGIHTGFCTVGNFGSEVRMDYTIIGGSVNTASRLESAATPGEILISFETYSLVKDKIQCVEKGSIEVKGIAYPVATYQVINSYENLKRQHEHFHETHPHYELDLDLDAMTAKERSEAAKLLKKGLGLIQDDKHSTSNKSKKR